MTANLDEYSVLFNLLNLAPSSLSVKGLLKKCWLERNVQYSTLNYSQQKWTLSSRKWDATKHF